VTRLGERAAGAMYWNLLGKFALMVLRFLESIVLVRLLGEDDFGAFSQAVNLNAIVVLVAALGLENALLRFLPAAVMAQGAAGERRLVVRALFLRAVVSAVVAALVWWQAPWLAGRLLHDSARAGLIKLVAVLLISMGFQNLFARVMVTRYEQKYSNLIQAGFTALYLLAAAAAVKLGGGISGVLWCQIAFNSALLAMFFRRWRRELPSPAGEKKNVAPVSWRQLFQFSGYTYVYNLLNFVFQKGMDVLLLGLLLTDLAPVTWYVLAYNFVFYSVSFFSNAFAEGVPLAIVSEVAAQDDLPKLRRVYAISIEYLYLFVIPIMIGGLLLGSRLLHLFYPEGPADGATVPMLVLLVCYSLAKIGSINVNFLMGLNRERILVVIRVAFGALNLLLDLLLIPRYQALGAAMATGTSVLSGVMVEWVVVHRHLRPFYPVRFLSKILLAGLTMGGGIMLLDLFIDWAPYLQVPALFLAGILVFTVMIFALRPFRREHAELLAKLPLPGKQYWLRRLIPENDDSAKQER